jgi:hypothetical protein
MIVLLVLGIISGGIGGVLVVLGAILGIISTLVKSSPRKMRAHLKNFLIFFGVEFWHYVFLLETLKTMLLSKK